MSWQFHAIGCISLLLFDPVGGMGILVERASWWNGHLGGTGILVERASCPLQSDGLSQY
ncbi:MAG: hypothetical protein F6K26_26070 [Moorea sp. SIO2I5]|nr:hypothetical protein [Moorena sp. SIO2I5]